MIKNKSKNRSQSGSVTLISLLLFMALFACSLFLLLQNLKTLRLTKERSQNYLCLKTMIAKTLELDDFIDKTNMIIATNYPLQFNPKTGPVHKAIIEVTKKTQELKLKKSQFEILKNQTCSFSNKILTARFLNLQTMASTILAREINETAKIQLSGFELPFSWKSSDPLEVFKNEKILVRFYRKQNQRLIFTTTFTGNLL